MQKILLSLVVFFVLELAVIIEVGSSIGAVNTILVMFLMMVLGVFLIKLRFRQAMDGLRNGTVDTSVFFPATCRFPVSFPRLYLRSLRAFATHSQNSDRMCEVL